MNGSELKFIEKSIRQAIEAGIAIVYQELTLVSQMTVGENVFLGKEPLKNGSINWESLYSKTRDLLQKYQLEISARALIKDIGVGKKQMAEIAKALSEDAKILILDEPTSALTEEEVKKLMEILRTLKSHGVTCIYISHKLEEFFGITDRLTVMRDGHIVSTEKTKDMTLEKTVQLMVGRQMKERFPPSTRSPGEVILEVENLHATDPNSGAREVLKGVSFDLRKGEILGIAGLMGSGRTETVTTIFGEYGHITQGSIKVDGKEVQIGSAHDAMEHKISLVPEDRKAQGLVLLQSVLENMVLPNMERFAKFMRINQEAAIKESLKYSTRLSIKMPNIMVNVNSLSGGNQQKVVISKWLMSEPRVLIMDDPTRGIDVGAKFEIYKLMNQLAESGVSIIMISSELEEVMGMSDRIVVMCEGRSNGTIDRSEATQEKIMALATGITEHNGASAETRS